MKKKTKDKKVEYFGQLSRVEIGSGEKTVSFRLTPQESLKLGIMLIAANSHYEQSKRTTGRSDLKPINQIMLTGHVEGKQITVLGRMAKKFSKK